MKKGLIILVILSSLVGLGSALYYEGYKDDYQNTTHIQVLNTVIHNSTINSITFNYSASGSGLIRENLTDGYIDVEEGQGSNPEPDATAYLRYVNDYSMQFFTAPLDKWGYVYKDYGVNFFNDWSATATVRITGYSSNGQCYAFSFCNSSASWEDVTEGIGVRIRHINTPNEYQITLVLVEGGVITSVDTYQYAISSAMKYLNFYKVDTDCYLEIYSDYARTTLLDNLTVTLSADNKYRYSHYGQLNDLDLTGRWISGNCYNLSFRNSGATFGYFYTKDLLANTSDTATAILFNSTIEATNSITMEFSSDNSTWLNQQNVAGYESLNDGLGAFNLEGLGVSTLYVRANFSRPLGADRCELHDITVIYEGSASAGGGVQKWLVFLVILLCVVGYLLWYALD